MPNEENSVLNVQRFVDVLSEAEEKLVAKEHAIAEQLQSLRSELKQIRGAKTCLIGPKSERKNGKKQAATKQDVTSIIEAALQQHGVLREEEIRDVVEAKLQKDGRSKRGLALRLRESLESDSFVKTDDGFQIRGAERQTAAEKTDER